MKSPYVITVSINTFDLLTADEAKHYPGQNLTREHFDNHILTALSGDTTRIFYIRDGASQDYGPVELGVDESSIVDISEFDPWDLNAEEYLRVLLARIVREEIEEEVKALADAEPSAAAK